MLYKAQSPLEALRIGLEENGGSRPKLARELGINNAHIYRALPASGGEGEVTPSLRARLVEVGWIPAKATRIRLAADLYDKWADRDGARARLRRQVLNDHARELGFESWSAFLRAYADRLIEEQLEGVRERR